MADHELIGIDVGATKTQGVLIGPDGQVRHRLRVATRGQSMDALLDMLIQVTTELRTPRVAGVGVGLPGMVDATAGTLIYAPSFPFVQAPLRGELAAGLGLPVVCDNDANVAAWAEHRIGAGAGHDDLVLVTLGTGLGCGIVVGGRLLRGAHGFATEVSHLILEPGGRQCRCGNRGCWGVEASGWTITMMARETGREPESWGADTAADITGELVTCAARRGDPAAVAILDRVGTVLGRGLAALANLVDPTILVVGGGASEAGDLLLAPARASLRAALYAADQRPEVPVVAARFVGDAGAVGAGLLADVEEGGAA